MKNIIILLKSIFLIVLFSACNSIEQYDLILNNAILFDGENYSEEKTTIFIREGKIAKKINSATFQQENYTDSKILDLDGNFTMPGLIEGHGHLLKYGEGLSQLYLNDCRSWEEVIQRVEKKASELEAGQWIEGRGWHQEKWVETLDESVEGYPIHNELSARIPNHPVYLEHASGHAAFANQRAMDMVGISIESVPPGGGRILRQASGQPTGIFEENSTIIFEEYIKSIKDLESIWESALREAAQSCIENGITSFQDAGLTVDQIEWLNKKAINRELPIRMWVMAFDSIEKLKNSFPSIKIIGGGNNYFTCRSIKAYLDGALGSRGAWLLKEYSDQANYFGQNTMTMPTMREYAEICKENDLQFCVHAIGDRGNRETLDLFSDYTDGNNDIRWRIEHAQHISAVDQPRFKELGVIASVQPVHCTSDAPFVNARLGLMRAQENAYIWRSLLNKNTRLAVGTDVPVESINPFENMYAAVTRKPISRDGAFFPEQAMTRQEILNLYTAGNAFAAFEEDSKGLISEGYLADLIITDRNLFTCTDEELRHAKILFTIIDGEIVYTTD